MKLEAIRVFADQVKRDFLSDAIACEVFYRVGNKWFSLETEEFCDENTSRCLECASKETVSYHEPTSVSAWYFVARINSGVRIDFAKSPKITKRRSYGERLKKNFDVALNSYKVTHNQLTQLLARDAFRDKLKESIGNIEGVNDASDDVEDIGVARALAVLALDIDHFKQINDTWGHLYGDQVLKIFALRLECAAGDILAEDYGKPKIYLGHPSGEEFLVAIEANAAQEKFSEWANVFRKKICDEIIPTEEDLRWLGIRVETSTIPIPPVGERGVAASVGLAMYSALPTKEVTGDPLLEILERADTALYKAKSAGRNQVVSYDEILTNCGRVIEQDPRTKIIALDIGSNVGVEIGQEFKVFLPTFTGRTKFFLNDGRTKRSLGLYPRVESARVVVFDAQPELSFAYIDAPADPPEIEPGSHLEAIPAGSIGHLLPSSSKFLQTGDSLGDRSGLIGLQNYLKSKKGSDAFVLVVRLSKEVEYLRKFGSVALNKALAHIYREAQIRFFGAKSIELLDKSSICIVGPDSIYEEQRAGKFLKDMASELPDLGVVGGVFCKADRTSSATTDQEPLLVENAMEFARFAAADAGREEGVLLRHFDYSTALTVLKALRDSRSFDRAYTDFKQLQQMGLNSSSFQNMGGIIASALGMPKRAMEHYFQAVTKNPKDLVFKTNYGIAANRAGETDAALKILNKVPLGEIDTLIERHAYGYLVYAYLLACAKLNDLANFDKSRFEHVAGKAIGMSEFENHSEMKIIKGVLDSDI